MSYLKFTRTHPVFTTFLFLLLIGIPLFSLAVESLLYGFIISIIFSVALAIYMINFFTSKDTKTFVRNLGSIVLKKDNISGENLITTSDFNELKILDFKNISKYKPKYRVSSLRGQWGMMDRAGSALTQKGVDIYKEAYENSLSFEFFLPIEKVYIKIPEFNYFSSLRHTWDEFKNWSGFYYQYPELQIIFQNLPEWIDRTEIYSQGDLVFVGIFAKKDFCLNHSLEVYKELVDLKHKLIH